jgi:hypothetical protein
LLILSHLRRLQFLRLCRELPDLDAILAVGYRVRSERGTQFRQWATNQLRELLVKGFVLDDERIKAVRTIGQDYTAAEIVHARANAAKPNMGLTSWKNSPRGPIRKADLIIAKNYLSQQEISELNRIVSMYLDYAEDQARKKPRCICATGSRSSIPSCNSTSATS